MPAPGTRRIAVMGDSIAFGYWVALEDAFPAQLEALLGARLEQGAVEVLNFGVPGYNLEQELAWLEHQALAFAPDLVVLALCLNDFESIDSYEYGLVQQRTAAKGPGRRLWERCLEVSLLASWVEYRLRERALRRDFAGGGGAAMGPLPAEVQRGARRRFLTRMQRLQQVLKPRQTAALVVVFPTLDAPPAQSPHAWLLDDVAEVCARLGLAHVDLRACYGAYPLAQLRVDPVHPSPLGHRVAAHAAAEAVVAAQLLPGLRFAAATVGCGDYRAQDFPTVRGY